MTSSVVVVRQLGDEEDACGIDVERASRELNLYASGDRLERYVARASAAQ